MKPTKSNFSSLKRLHHTTIPLVLWIIWAASTNCITQPETPLAAPKTVIAMSCQLPAPDEFSAQSGGNGAVTLSWQPVSGATGYQLSVYNAVTRELVYNHTIDGSSVTLHHLPAGVSYQCTLACRCSNHEISGFIISTEVIL